MSSPVAPRGTQAPQHPDSSVPQGVEPDRDEPNAFGPDTPNVRVDDPPGGQGVPEAPPPTPLTTALNDDDFAPDEV